MNTEPLSKEEFQELETRLKNIVNLILITLNIAMHNMVI